MLSERKKGTFALSYPLSHQREEGIADMAWEKGPHPRTCAATVRFDYLSDALQDNFRVADNTTRIVAFAVACCAVL